MISPPTLAQRLSHREAPSGPFVMHQEWRDLLFLHWRYDPAEIQKTLPPGLYVDTFEGSAWVAVVPFFMRGIRPRFCPPVPGISNFLETNVRTYVHDEQGRSGVWFYSLDCNLPLAVWTARTVFHLPYEHAAMSASKAGDGTVGYHSQRRGAERGSEFIYQLQPETHVAEPGGLEFFLAERYLLFANTPKGLRTGQVHHVPYPLAAARVEAWDTGLLRLAGLSEPGREPDHIIGSPGVRVRIWPLGK